MRVDGKTVFVTGSSRGIGRDIAQIFAESGATVILHGREHSNELDTTASDLKAKSLSVHTVIGDLASADAHRQIFQQIDDLNMDVDILILNASVQVRKRWTKLSVEDYSWQMDVNLRSTLLLLQQFVPTMQERGWGRVVTIGSVQQFKPHPKMAIYAATKDAQMSIVRNIATQVAKDGVTVNNLAVGVVETDRNREMLQDPAYRSRVIRQIPAGRLGRGDECAYTALFLCTDFAKYITGSNIPVDGGLHLS